MDSVKEKLAELIRNAHKKCKAKKTCHECEKYGNGSDCVYLFIADDLIANGVTVQEMDGCEFCNAEYAEWSEGVSHDFRIKGNALYYYDNIYGWEGIIIHHCPMCGRRLPQSPKGE